MKRFVLGYFGVIAGFLFGWVVVFCWALLTANLMGKGLEYEKRSAFILLIILVVVGLSTILGGLLATFGLGSQKRSGGEIKPPDS